MEKRQAIEVTTNSVKRTAHFLAFQNEDYATAQLKKDKMEIYRAETYKQLQVLNLLDVVIVSQVV